jgi:hypothetical protein
MFGATEELARLVGMQPAKWRGQGRRSVDCHIYGEGIQRWHGHVGAPISSGNGLDDGIRRKM